MRIGLVSLHIEETQPMYPMGVIILGTILKKRFPDFEVEIIDANFDNLIEKTLSGKFDLIGVSAMTIYYNAGIRYAQTIKSNISIPIFVGGVHISTLPESLDPCFDFGVVGEGEETIVELVELFQKERKFSVQSLSKINGLIYREANGQLTHTPQRSIVALENVPNPDWSLINSRYFDANFCPTWVNVVRQGYLLTSRGCPFKCIFCSSNEFWQKNIRYHTAEQVVDSIKSLVLKGVNHIQFFDDLFSINLIRLKKIKELLEKENLLQEVNFYCSIRAKTVNDELCEVLKGLNVKIVFFGFESGNDRVLSMLKGSKATVDENKNAINTCIKHKLLVQGSVILASPTEKLEEMRDTLDFVTYAAKKKVTRVISFVMTPYPNTEVWNIALQRGKLTGKNSDWDLLTQNNENHPLLLDDSIPIEEFKKITAEFRRRTVPFQVRKILIMLGRKPFHLFKLFFTEMVYKLGIKKRIYVTNTD